MAARARPASSVVRYHNGMIASVALFQLTTAGCVLLSLFIGSVVHEVLSLYCGRDGRAPWYALPVAAACTAALLLLLLLLVGR